LPAEIVFVKQTLTSRASPTWLHQTNFVQAKYFFSNVDAMRQTLFDSLDHKHCPRVVFGACPDLLCARGNSKNRPNARQHVTISTSAKAWPNNLFPFNQRFPNASKMAGGDSLPNDPDKMCAHTLQTQRLTTAYTTLYIQLKARDIMSVAPSLAQSP